MNYINRENIETKIANHKWTIEGIEETRDYQFGHIPSEEIQALYKEVGLYFPSELYVELDNLYQFFLHLVQDRRKRCNREIEMIKQEIKELEELLKENDQ